MGRYDNNLGIMNQKELNIINNTNVLLIGAGGLGGYVANSLARLGIINLTIVDNDYFVESNLNRQLYSNMKTIGKSKVKVTKKELLKINPSMKITIYEKRYNESIDDSVFNDIDIVFEAVDNIETRLLIEADCTKHNVPLIHGAIAGWTGWVGIIMPNTNIFQDIYQYKKSGKGVEETLKSPTFIPAIIANLMATEFVKFLLNKKSLTNQILFIDVLEHEYRIIYKK
ncbi:MAG: ThiF family adenylyltransferase [Candidatus Izemoplasma sp.]